MVKQSDLRGSTKKIKLLNEKDHQLWDTSEY